MRATSPEILVFRAGACYRTPRTANFANLRGDQDHATVAAAPYQALDLGYQQLGSSIFALTLTDEDSAMRINKPYEPAAMYRLPAPETPEGADTPQT